LNLGPPEPHQSGRKSRRNRRVRICQQQSSEEIQAQKLARSSISPESSAARVDGPRRGVKAALLWPAGCRLSRFSGSPLNLEGAKYGALAPQPEGRGFESHFPLQNTYTLRKAGHFAQPFSPQSGDHLLSRQRHRSARAAGRRPNSMDPAAAYGGRSVSQGQSPVTTAISNLSSAGNCALSLHPRLAHRCCANIPSASQREGARAQMV
jgi:hypothetical protein